MWPRGVRTSRGPAHGRKEPTVDRESVAQPAPTPTTPREAIVECIEQELSRLRQRRPHLDRRIERATNLLVVHLSSPSSVIRIRVGAGGPRFLVASLNDRGAVYSVDPETWSCSCPAAHRYKGPCKHVLSAYVLWRVAQPDRSHDTVVRQDSDGCPVCENGLVRRTENYVNTTTGELKERTLSLPCRACGGAA